MVVAKKKTQPVRPSKKKFSASEGKRKTAIARAIVKEGIGRVRVNGKLLELYEPETARLRIMEPLVIAGPIAKQLNVDVNVIKGGWSSQAESARLAIAKALVEYTKSEELKNKYLDYDRLLLVADTRRKEQRKPMCHGKARAKRQKSYR